MNSEPAQSLWKRLTWMALIWLGSVITLGIVAGAIKLWLKA